MDEDVKDMTFQGEEKKKGKSNEKRLRNQKLEKEIIKEEKKEKIKIIFFMKEILKKKMKWRMKEL